MHLPPRIHPEVAALTEHYRTLDLDELRVRAHELRDLAVEGGPDSQLAFAQLLLIDAVHRQRTARLLVGDLYRGALPGVDGDRAVEAASALSRARTQLGTDVAAGEILLAAAEIGGWKP